MLISLPVTFSLVIASLVQTLDAVPVPIRVSFLSKRGAFQGEGTYYDPGLGSCEIVSSDNEYIAALNHVQFGVFARPKNSPACFSCAMVHGPSGSVKVKIVDMCPGCKYGDIDLSSVAFEKIARKEQGRVPISWEYVSCGGNNENQPISRPTPTKSANPSKKSNSEEKSLTSTQKPKSSVNPPTKAPAKPYKNAPEPTHSVNPDENGSQCAFTTKCHNPGQSITFNVCVHGKIFQQSCAPGTVCKEANGEIFCDWA